MALVRDEVGRIAYLLTSLLRRLGHRSVGIAGQSDFLKNLLFKNGIKVQTDFMSQGVSKSALSKVSGLVAYNPEYESVSSLSGVFDDFMVIACWNVDFSYEDWRKSLCQMGKLTPIYRSDSYQVVVVTKCPQDDSTH